MSRGGLCPRYRYSEVVVFVLKITTFMFECALTSNSKNLYSCRMEEL